MHLRGLVLLGALAPALLAAPAGGAPPRDVRLSDESTFTRTANTYYPAAVRSRPRAAARAVGRLRYRTEDGLPEVYLALRGRRDERGRLWVRIRLPGRPNGRTGWVPRDALGPWHLVHTLLRVDRRTLRATLYRGGRRVLQVPVGVGRPATPTPAGHFYVRELLHGLGGNTVYGPWAFGTSAYSSLSDWPRGGVVGIHGTDQPGLIPGRPSHGCIRLRNGDISRLARLMPVGTPVRVL